MKPSSPLSLPIAFHLGPVPVTQPVVTTWVIVAVLSAAAALATRRLTIRPGRPQAALELLVVTLERQIGETAQSDGAPLLPLVGTLFLYIAVANCSGVLPGVHAPTAHLETAAALAAIVFSSVHVFGVRRHGLRGYLSRFARPNILLLPLNVVSETTRAFSLMLRLFGNVMSGEFLLALVLSLAGLLVPLPFMVLELLVGLVQAYIFATLSAVFLGAALGASEKAAT